MAIRKIARLGHPILRKIAQEVPVTEIQTPKIQKIIADMKDTVIDADGAGLAAPQIHESVQIVLVDLDDGKGFQVWINPQIEPLSDDITVSFEGCLSVPDLRGAVTRYANIKLKAYNEKAEPIEYILEDFPATVAQHECDHLFGIVYIDRAEPGTLSFLQEYKRYQGHLWSMMGEESEEESDEAQPTFEEQEE